MESGLSPAERVLFWHLHHQRDPNHGFRGVTAVNVEWLDRLAEQNPTLRSRAELIAAGLMEHTDPHHRYISLTWDGWEALRRAMMTTRGPDEQRVL